MLWFLFFIFFSGAVFSEENLVIIGGGPAGLTAAMFAAEDGLKPLVIEGTGCKELTQKDKILENFPGFDQGIKGKQLISQMKEQAKKLGATFLEADLLSIDLSNPPFHLTLSNNQIIDSKSVIIATGSIPRRLGLVSEKALLGKGVLSVTYCQEVDFSHKEVVIVGGGDAALEEALNLSHVAAKVTLVNISEELTGALLLQKQVNENDLIKKFLSSKIENIFDVKSDKVTAVLIKNTKTNEETKVSADYVIVAIGYVPNSELFQNQLEMQKSFIKVIPGTTQTSRKGVFAAGNVMDPRFGKAITASAFGCMAAIEAKQYLTAPITK